MKYLYKKSMVIMLFFLLIGAGSVPCICANIENVSNPDELKDYELIKETKIEYDSAFEYVIITNQDLKYSNFNHLVSHKSQYLNATIVTTENIEDNPDFWVDGIYGDATSKSNGNPFVEDGEEVTRNHYFFNDTQAKIRNFIRYAYKEWNTEYVLLGGDVDIIPDRKLRIHDANWFNGVEYTLVDADIPSDLYYACLDGTWNNDFDGYFGEHPDFSVDEEADLIAEVYVGRAPVSNKNEVKTFVDKVIHFETNEKPIDIQLHQAGINQINVPDSTVIPEFCDQRIPDDYIVHKLYQINEEVTVEKWIECFQEPDKIIIAHVGSGRKEAYYLDRQLANDIEFSIYDVNNLDNDFYPIHLSIACNSGDFGGTNDCLAERMLLWEFGGPSACFFNSHYGFAVHYDALPYSGEVMVLQFHEIFQNHTHNLGKINQFSKEYFVDNAYGDLGYRWCYYTVNLLGDPETPIFETRDEYPLFDEVFVDDNFNPSTPGWSEDHFDKIQDGVNGVAENGVVHVFAGLYHESVVIDKTLNLIGENRETTIIEGGNNENVITINTNSTVVKYFTLKHAEADPFLDNLNGIVISPNREGNEIENNTILKNSLYGVLVLGSCHNNIRDNIINSNGIGVGLINPENLYGQDPHTPCDNVVCNNVITYCTILGVYIAFASNNHIRNNRFVNNQENGNLPGVGPDAFFINEEDNHNEWNKNYWNEPRNLPKSIYGRSGPISIFSEDISENINKGILTIEYDYNPEKSRSRNIIGFRQKMSFLRIYQAINEIISSILQILKIQ